MPLPPLSKAPANTELPLSEAALPLHQQITRTLMRQIESGQIRPGEMLPPELELARQVGVSRHTMRMGLESLVRAGLIERHRGKGTVVRQPPIQQHLARFYSIAREMRQRGLELKTQVLARGRLHAQDELAALACERLELADPSQVGFLLRLRQVEGTPLLLETVTFPAALCPVLLDAPHAQADDPGAASFYEVLIRQANMRVMRAHETFRPVLVNGYEARLLGISTETPIFEVERTSFVGDQKVEWRRTLARGDRYIYAVDLLNPVEEGDIGE